ncbi:MAG: hypothetical protein KC474_01575 [Cyanobacteria bacterium HKST-UBA04]|nr:hypothetical protein [Cyanobacteria bacterium HKST-UBA04]MCA9840744.1 hypothetical protein [Cyanobacteria bacterium HKST-UBA03]
MVNAMQGIAFRNQMQSPQALSAGGPRQQQMQLPDIEFGKSVSSNAFVGGNLNQPKVGNAMQGSRLNVMA